MLSATCKTFLKTLKETMTLINENIKEDAISDVPISPTLKRVSKLRRTPSTTSLPIGLGQNQDLQSKKTHKRTSSNSTQFSIGSLDLCPPENGETKSLQSFAGITKNEQIDDEAFAPTEEVDDFADANSDIEIESSQEPSPEKPSAETIVATPPPTTFFNQMKYSFESVQVTQDSKSKSLIPTEPFLLASGDFLPILDKLGSKAFQPVKMDISGNISKIRTKYETDREKFPNLQAIILHEKSTNTTSVQNSATDAIMWLKRGLTFVKEFLKNVTQGEEDLTRALQNAYTSSLARHHGWVVRGVFHLAVKAAPYYNDFIDALTDGSNEPGVKGQLMEAMTNYTNSLERILDILDEFYQENQLESNKLI